MKVAGFGFRTGASLDSLHAALATAGGADGLSAIATVADKADTPVFKAFGAALGLKVTRVPQDAITAAPVATQSSKSQELRGTGSLSEAAALAAIGKGASLIAPRSISGDKMATCAIAQRGNE
jgi:cobalt-precorrin 5A hydrolase